MKNSSYSILTAEFVFLTGALCLSAGRGVLRLTRLPRHDRGVFVYGEKDLLRQEVIA